MVHLFGSNQRFLGRSPAFRHMLGLIARVAPTDSTVLLQGESGTGKELAAQAIHETSHRSKGPFVAVDCSGLPETLFESELFGYEKGAFTGATARKTGLVEAASGGTLFLDEVGDIPMTMQVKLLRLLETGCYRRVGATNVSKADFRLVSATHRPLRQLIAEGHFRHDLFYRISTFPITLPALRDRVGDIPVLAEALLRRVAPGRHLTLSADALKLLEAYDYPGNIRELRNLLERASLLCDGDELLPEHLADEVRNPLISFASGTVMPSSPRWLHEGPEHSWEDIQLNVFQVVVAAHHGTRKELARKLGVSHRTLYRRLAQMKNATVGKTS